MKRYLAIFSAGFAGLFLVQCSGTDLANQMCPGLITPAAHTAPELVTQGVAGPSEQMQEMVSGLMSRVIDGRMADAPQRQRQVVNVNLLAISTGGQYGAFASGFLSGWTKSGNRPDFDVVTGASAGGVIAPIAFAGSEFDTRLALNSNISDADVVRRRGLLELLSANAIYDTGRFEDLVESAIDAQLIEAIAQRWRDRNELLIGATNLNSGRFDLMALGKFSADEDIEMTTKVRCLTQAALATSAIPGLFPPRKIDGVPYVDAGIREHIFLEGIERGLRAEAAAMNVDVRVTAYLIINSDLKIPPRDLAEPGLIDVAERSFELVIDDGLRASLLQTVDLVERAGWTLRAVRAPDFDTLGCADDDALFSSCVTQALFERGEAMMQADDFQWNGPQDVRDIAAAY